MVNKPLNKTVIYLVCIEWYIRIFITHRVNLYNINALY